MAGRKKKGKKRKEPEMSNEELDRYFQDRGIDIEKWILKLKMRVLKYKMMNEEEIKRAREKKPIHKETKFKEAEITISEGKKGEARINVTKIIDTEGDFKSQYGMVCKGLYGEDGTGRG